MGFAAPSRTAVCTREGALNTSSWNSAQRVCVIGAGTMGAGIAAHLANVGFDVDLLDLDADSAAEAFARAKSAKPPHLYLSETAAKIRLGGIAENLAWVAEADWVCEAIVEKLDAKRELFANLEPLLQPNAMVSTNTSGLQIGLLTEGRSDSFRARFLGTHFFNPPRYLKLLELIPTGETDPQAVSAMAKFLEERCARRVVIAKDTPGFIANRFGMWSMFHAVHTAERLGLSVEQTDAICGPFLGRPRSAAFRLNDIVGLDIMQDIANNLIARCSDDPHIDVLNTPRSMATLMERGHIGAKSGAGYYKREGKELLAIDLGTLAYRQAHEPELPSLQQFGKLPLGERLRAALDARDEVGEFLRMHLVPVLRYADYLKEEISRSVLDFDRVMQWGFAWEAGPFALIDAIVADRVGIEGGDFYQAGKQRSFAGPYVSLPVEPEYRSIADFPVLRSTEALRIRDLGDGVEAVCLATKMGTITPQVVEDLHQYLDDGPGPFVLASEARHFSVGFDLNFFLQRIQEEAFEDIDRTLGRLQQLTLRLGRERSVAAVFGYCLGAGMELAMGCAQVCALAEANLGLPEAKVGLLPGGAGTVLMAQRAQRGGAKHTVEVCLALSTGFTSANADEGRRLGYLRPMDRTVYHPDRLLAEAKTAVLAVEPEIDESWTVPIGPVNGMIDQGQRELQAKGDFSAHDELISDQIKHVFTKTASLDGALTEERVAFLSLCRSGLTVARIRHMLETGKPLRN